MDIFRVSFIGHRVVDEYRQVEEELDEVIELLHRKYGFIDFNVDETASLTTLPHKPSDDSEENGRSGANLRLSNHIPWRTWIL